MGQTCEERAETYKAENTRHRGVMLVEGKAKVMDAGRRVVRDVLGGRGGEGRGGEGSHVGDLLKEETCRAIDEESKGRRKI